MTVSRDRSTEMDFDYDHERESWKWEIPEFYNIGRDCTDTHAADPSTRDHPAMHFEAESGESHTLTFADLARETDRMANALREFGIERGQRVLIRLDNCPELPLVFLGAIKMGAVPIPTSNRLTAQELAYIASDSGAVAVVTSPDLYPLVPQAREASGAIRHTLIVRGEAPPGTVDFAALAASGPDTFEGPETRAEDLAYICYTSGTTGYPRGVMHAHRSVIGRGPATKYWQALRGDDVVFHSGKLNWTYTLGTGCIDPWRAGVTVVIWGGQHDIRKFYGIIGKYGVTVYIGVPTVFRQMLRFYHELGDDLATLRHVLCAGEHLSAELCTEWKDRTGIEIYDGLGMSEFSYYLTNMVGMPVRPGSSGKPQPGHASTLLDGTGREVGPGEVGVLATPRDDPGIMLGYWNLVDQTDGKFSGDWFISGDYFYKDSEGYYWFIGRNDDLINTFGFRVSPLEVERVLGTYPGVEECAVAGVDIGDGKTIIVGFVVLESGVVPSAGLMQGLKAHASTSLADYKCPKEIQFVDAISKTSNGKVRRRVLKENYLAAVSGG